MNARAIIVDADDWMLTISRWQRQSEELLLKRLYGVPEAGEEIEEDAAPDPDAPRVLPRDDEYAWASALGRTED